MAEKSDSMKQKGVCDDHNDSDDDAQHQFGQSLLKLELAPKKKLLILSIGGLLCHRVNRKDRSLKFQAPINRRPDAVYGSYKVYKRPSCEDFVKFCLERFEVGIWSSAREWYLDSSLSCIMPGLKSKVVFAWDQYQCTDSGFKSLEDKRKPIFLKQTVQVWACKFPRGRFSESNTLLIDNDPYKALLNPANTAIFPTEYKANYHVNDNALGPNGELRQYLQGLADAENVPSYVREHPFGQPAISRQHPNWDYYSKIIDRFASSG